MRDCVYKLRYISDILHKKPATVFSRWLLLPNKEQIDDTPENARRASTNNLSDAAMFLSSTAHWVSCVDNFLLADWV